MHNGSRFEIKNRSQLLKSATGSALNSAGGLAYALLLPANGLSVAVQ